jgi:peptidoglycan hydrolase CwlO-like protein
MSKGSGTSNKPPIQPNVSPKQKDSFSYREAGVAIAMVIFVIIAAILLTVGFRNNYEKDLEKATAEAANTKAELEAKINDLIERDQELTARETELNLREAKLSTREAAMETAQAELENSRSILASDMQNFNEEESEFIEKQFRIKELCEALLLELAPEQDE